MADADYQDWSKDRLVSRLRELEEQLKAQQQKQQQPPPKQKQKQPPANPKPGPGPKAPQIQGNDKEKKKKKPSRLDPSKYSTRLVALKLAYLGKRFGGFEYQAGASVPSIEEELWRALAKSCLIWPDDPDKVDFAPWEYSKCGRTDRGVSAFGQVVGVRVRSNRPLAVVEETVSYTHLTLPTICSV